MAAKNKSKKKKEVKKEDKPRVSAGNVIIKTPQPEFVKERIGLLQECSRNVSSIINAVENLKDTGSEVSMTGDYKINGNVQIGADKTNMKESHFIFSGEGDQEISSDSEFNNVTIDKGAGTMTVKDTMMRILNDLTFLTQNMD